jgi:hypothetical protein
VVKAARGLGRKALPAGRLDRHGRHGLRPRGSRHPGAAKASFGRTTSSRTSSWPPAAPTSSAATTARPAST